MTLHEFLLLFIGIGIGWVTKIPIFLKYYKNWEHERDEIRRFIKEIEKK